MELFRTELDVLTDSVTVVTQKAYSGPGGDVIVLDATVKPPKGYVDYVPPLDVEV